MDMSYGSVVRKASEYRRKARAWERAASAIDKAHRALSKAQDIETDDIPIIDSNGKISYRAVAHR